MNKVSRIASHSTGGLLCVCARREGKGVGCERWRGVERDVWRCKELSTSHHMLCV